MGQRRQAALADAAAAMRDGHARALDARAYASPRTSCDPGTGRRGPAELWTRFDAAVQRLNEAGAGDNVSEVVDAYATVAQAAAELADALEGAGE